MNKITLAQGMLVALFSVSSISAVANPTGGQVASGAATIGTVPGTVTINQTSNYSIINWQSFSINSGELTQFIQPSSTSAALNRVLGGQTSVINGNLTANGQIYLVNGNGILVGAGGNIRANTFIGSTRDIADTDFLSGNLHFTGSNAAGVTNQGTISALGGDVYLIGQTVDNQGIVNASHGTAGLAAANDVLLNLNGDEHVFVSPSLPATSTAGQTAIHNGGTIAAASAELKAANGNMYALAINNEGTVRATTVANRGGRIFLTSNSGLIQNTGTLAAQSGSNGGAIKIKGGSVWNRKTIDASGTQGGSVAVNASNIQNDGTILVKGTQGNGGSVALTYSGNALGSKSGLIDASGATQGGSIQFLGTAADSESYLSLKLDVSSANGAGGLIEIQSPSLYLAGAVLKADGAQTGGKIMLNRAASGHSFVQTAFVKTDSSISAVNGVVETASETNPQVSSTTGFPSFEFIDPDRGPNNRFGQPGTGIFSLTTNNTLITSPGDSFGGEGAGAVYLFSNLDGALLSTLRGSHPGDAIGASVEVLDGRNFAVKASNWNNNTGAVTFGTGSSGFANGGGTVSSANSLVGSAAGDLVGSGGLVRLFSGDYLVLSPNWNGNTGAVTWVNPTLGINASISADNSLVGAAAGDSIGSGGVFSLSNGGNFLILSPHWNDDAGAVTNGNVNNSLLGIVSAANSLVGASTGDRVGSGDSILDTHLGYYLVTTADWNNGAGAVTYANNALGVTGQVSSENSLIGASAGDQIGSGGITLLTATGNYIVSSPNWNAQSGAVTFGDGSRGVSGVVSSNNSLVGAAPGDLAGSGGITVLTDHHGYVVSSPNWNNGAGAVTMGTSSAGVSGLIRAANSLIGATSGDLIGSGGLNVLTNGNFLVLSPHYNGAAGAVTFEDIASPRVGQVGSANSLVGAHPGDSIGSGGIYQLSNGANYLVLSPEYNGGAGAVTNGSNVTGVSGFVSSANSLVGASTTDGVGMTGSISDFYSGYYLVGTSNWNGGAGAVTWNSDTAGTVGVVSAGNSLVGSSSSDHVGSGGIVNLYNDNFLVLSPDWNNRTGAVTWGSATGGLGGVVGSTNSLVGATSGDRIGSGGIFQLSNINNFLVLSPEFNGGAGAITNAGATGPVIGVVSEANSLVGSSSTDRVGSVGSIIDSYAGYYLVSTQSWNNGAGAVTWNSDSSGTTGFISEANSLVGSSLPDGGGSVGESAQPLFVGGVFPVNADRVGSGGITILSNGNYVVSSPDWNGTAGAVTVGTAQSGIAGVVSRENSLVGGNTGDAIGSGGLFQLSNNQNFLILSPDWNGGAGAITNADNSGITGVVSAANSLVGASSTDAVGLTGSVLDSTKGYYLVHTAGWGGGAGAVTWNSDSQGKIGVVSASNSLVGTVPLDNYSDVDGDRLGSGGISVLANGNYLVLSPHWHYGNGAATLGNGATGTTGVVSATNSLVGETNSPSDSVGSGGLKYLANGNVLVLSPHFSNDAGAVTFLSATTGVTGVIGSANSVVGNTSGEDVGTGDNGITLLSNGNYLILTSNYRSGAGAVTWGSEETGSTGVVGAANSLIGTHISDHIGSGGIIQLPNSNYLVISPYYTISSGAATWGSGTAPITGYVNSTNSVIGGQANSGVQFAGLSADSSLYLVAFTTDQSRGGDGRVFAGSVNGPSMSPDFTSSNIDYFAQQSVITFETTGLDRHRADTTPYAIIDPNAWNVDTVSVGTLYGGALNDGEGKNMASGSSTAYAPGPQRLVTPGNGIWNIFNGVVHSTPPPSFVVGQLEFNLSPSVLASLSDIVFGHN